MVKFNPNPALHVTPSRCEACGCGEMDQYGERTFVRRRDEHGATLCAVCARDAYLDDLEYREGVGMIYLSGPSA